MEKTTPIVVRFSRNGDPKRGAKLSSRRKYRITVNNGPWENFQLPWDESELNEHIKVLRNLQPGTRPCIDRLEKIGRELGAELGKIKSFTRAMDEPARDIRCVIWILGWPELARIPWELATRWISPYKHLLLEDGMSFVRRVPTPSQRQRTSWPTGQKRSLRLLYVWSETSSGDVPHEAHFRELQEACADNNVQFVASEVEGIADLQRICEKTSFDFVHILAHGAKTYRGHSGLQFTNERINGEQLARVLQSRESRPALVTLAACDAGAEEEVSYGSVAYELHIHGIPMVRASLFRLRKESSVYSVKRVYKALLTGDHPLHVLSSIRRNLSPRDNESWANEVIYLGHVTDTLDEAAAVGRQQGVHRRAQVIAARYEEPPADPAQRQIAIKQLEAEISRLKPLIDEGFDLPETYGLLGSLTRRIAYIRNDPPDEEELRDASEWYESGFRANSIAHYPGIDAIHLSRLLGENEKAKTYLPIVRFALENEISKEKPDYWAFATAGELEVYAGNSTAAVKYYRQFLRRQREVIHDCNRQHSEVRTAHRQLEKFLCQIASKTDAQNKKIKKAAEACIKLLAAALHRLETASIDDVGMQPEKKEESASNDKCRDRDANEQQSATAGEDRDRSFTSSGEIYDIHMLPASMGDALWIEYGSASKPNRILIDGGKSDTANVIRTRILDIAAREGECRLELLVVSHIDADHIEGIIKLLGDASLKDKLIIDDVWFNGTRHLPDPASENESDCDFMGARAGEFLSALLKKRKLKWNKSWKGKTIFVPQAGALPSLQLPGGMNITLLSPTFDTMLKLSRRWEKELVKAKLDGASDEQILEAFCDDRRLAPDDEFLGGDGHLDTNQDIVPQLVAAKIRKDTSPANGSSIAFIASFDDRSCLFSGDAYSHVLHQGIGRLLQEQGKKSLSLGAFKLPHHGSCANLHEPLLKKLDCQHFLVSTDGSQFHHPDKQAIAHIVGGPWRSDYNSPVDLHFNYRTQYNETWNESRLKDKWNYKVHFPRKDDGGLVFRVP